MRRRNLIFFYLLVCLFHEASGQVNLQTGSAIYGLPIFNWSDAKSRLNINVVLTYNSGNGLKTGEVASSIGQGWNLQAGGVITRMQVGEPDDQISRDVNDLTKYPTGYLNNLVDVNLGCPNQLTRYPIYKHRNQLYKENNPIQADRELDYFSFQFNGRTGIFVLDKNTHQGVCLGDSKLKISFSLNNNMSYQNKGIRTTIDYFTIQDENGLKYKFSVHSLASVLKSNFCDATLNHQLTQPSLSSGGIYYKSGFEDNSIINPYVINGWYLSQIEDVFTNRVINFNYDFRNINHTAGVSIGYYETKDYLIISNTISKTISPVIQNISMPDGHNINFDYNLDRIDLNGDKILTDINILYNNSYISKFKLNSSYFILNRYGIPKSDYQKKVARLCLKSIVQYSADLKGQNQPYIFDYYLGTTNNADDIVSPPFSPMKDIWGFYNGDESKSYNGNSFSSFTLNFSEMTFDEIKGLCFLRYTTGTNITLKPKDGYAKNGLLKQIRYPGGGALTYEYEQNVGYLGSQYRTIGGVHVARTKLVDGGNSTAGGYSNDCDHPLITHFSYNQDGTSQSSLWGIEEPINKMVASSYYEPEQKYWTWKGGLFGSCRYRYQYPGILSIDQSVDLTSAQKSLIAFGEIMSCISTITAVLDVINLIAGTGPHGIIVMVILDVIFGVINVIKTCFSGTPNETSITNIFFNMDLKSINPLPVQFSRTVVKQGDGSNGYAAYTFTNPYTGTHQFPIWENSNPLYSMKQRFGYWLYGLPEKTTIFNANNDKIKESENVYSSDIAKVPFAYGYLAFPSCKCEIVKSSSQRNPDWETAGNNPSNYTINASSNTNLKAEIYDMYTGRVELSDTYEKIYDINQPTNYVEQHTHFQYNNINLQVNKIITTQSTGIKNCTDITYSCDYNSGIFSNLNNANLISLPVKKISSIIPVSGGKKILQESVTEYTTLSNGDIKPLRSLVQRTNEPVDESLWTTYSGTTGNLNNAFKETQKFTYDINGNLVGVIEEGNRFITNKYDYNYKFTVAVIINAKYQEDPTAYTSFETTNLGGWLLSGSASFNNTQSITGNRGFNLNNAVSLTANLNNTKLYRLSFWASTGSSISVGSTLNLIKSGPTIGNFTFYEYEIPDISTYEIPSNCPTTVSITGTGSIDELRLYPSSARMKSVTFDPLVGKTSECDENNRITYFEYDELGRLRFIKDDYRNIVKMNEYNVRKMGCINTFTNKLVSEIYRKDCSQEGDYIGINIIYTIPAGTYTSNVSQDEVDQQVQADLEVNGQAFANANGTCIPVFYNQTMSVDFIPETCEFGYISAAVSYSVPARKYSSIIDQATANQLASAEIAANGQAYANTHANCVIDYAPIWEAVSPEQTQCEINVYGKYTGHILVLVHDVNPNSSSYNQTPIWKDGGLNPSCPITTPCSGYTIEVPNSVASNLYIEYWDCATNSQIIKIWSAMNTVANTNSTTATICTSHGPIFRTGSSTGTVVSSTSLGIIITSNTTVCP